MPGASFDRANSRQDWEKPADLMAAVVARWGPIAFDLAATEHNSKAGRYHFSPYQDSLMQPWSGFGNRWLNPPYSNIEPWAEKCAKEHGAGRILFLIPASVGSNYWARWIDRWAHVYFLSPRLKFVGAKDPYPKDCALCVYGETPGYECWRWKP
jgi:phage N-6-adenine-methyltransferase